MICAICGEDKNWFSEMRSVGKDRKIDVCYECMGISKEDAMTDTEKRRYEAYQELLSICDEECVICHVCNGTKVSPYVKTNPCMCCKGLGMVTKKRLKSLKSVAEDIKRRLMS